MADTESPPDAQAAAQTEASALSGAVAGDRPRAEMEALSGEQLAEASAASAGAEQTTPRRGLSLATFRVLRHRDFTLLWSGLIVSAVGTWMQIVAQSLLILKITHGNALALGLVSLTQALSFFIFALPGGGIADRVNKRAFLLITQSALAGLALLLGILVATNVIQIWMIVVIAFVSGAILSFDQPTRSSLIPLLVPREELLSAVSLQAVVFNGAAVFGPALAAYTLLRLGFAANFFLNAVSFLGALVALAAIRLPARAQEARESRGSLWGNVREALGQVRRDEALPWLVSGYGAMLFFGPSGSLILPIFATAVLRVGTSGLALLFTMGGVGTVLGGLITASLGRTARKGPLALGGVLIWSVAFVIFAFTRSFPLACALLLVSSAAQNVAAASISTLMQLRVPPRMRGRVMSLNTLLIMGVRPLGDFPASALIGPLGAPVVVALGTGLVGLYALAMSVTRPTLRRTP